MFKNINLFVNILYVILKTIHQPIYDELIKALIKARKEAFNNAMGVATVLAINQFNFVTMIFIEYAVIKDKIAIVV